MTQKSILLIGNRIAKTAKRLAEEAAAVGVMFDMVACKDIFLHEGKLQVASPLSREVLGYDVYLFRGLNEHRVPMMEQVAKYLLDANKCVVERQLGEGGFPNDKVIPVSKDGTYTVPKTSLVSQDSLPSLLSGLTYPLVAKTLNESMGRGVAKIDSLEALQEFSASAGETFILQEYFELEYDTRVFVLGGKVLGAFNRYKPDGEDFLTTRSGGRRESVVVGAAVAAAAIEATALQGLVMAGVDLFVKDEVVYIIEVNVSPQFVRFEKATGINAAAAIVAHITGAMSQRGSTV